MTWAVTTKTMNCATQLITAAEENALEVSRAPGSSKITKMFIFLNFQFCLPCQMLKKVGPLSTQTLEWAVTQSPQCNQITNRRSVGLGLSCIT